MSFALTSVASIVRLRVGDGVGSPITANAFDIRPRDARCWAACAAISIGVHAALLLVATSGSSYDAFAKSGASAVEVRLVGTAPIHAERASPIESDWQPLAPFPKPVANARTYPAMLAFAPVELPRRAFDEKAYLPLSKLTQPPTPIQRVAVPYPEGAAQGGSVTARLILFIDENGSVARVDVGTAELPAAFAVAAMETFETARFHPGEVDGTPVKVRMVIDVEFEDRGDPRFKRNRKKARV